MLRKLWEGIMLGGKNGLNIGGQSYDRGFSISYSARIGTVGRLRGIFSSREFWEREAEIEGLVFKNRILLAFVCIVVEFCVAYYVCTTAFSRNSSPSYIHLIGLIVVSFMLAHRLVPFMTRPILMRFGGINHMRQSMWHAVEHRVAYLLESNIRPTPHLLATAPSVLLRCGTAQEILGLQKWLALWLFFSGDLSILISVCWCISAEMGFHTSWCQFARLPFAVHMTCFVIALPAALPALLWERMVNLREPDEAMITEAHEMCEKFISLFSFVSPPTR